MKDYVTPTSRRSGKYIYRFICSAVLTLIATAFFGYFWYGFAKENNQTGHLLGYGNLGMSIGIYMILYAMIGNWLHAFTIGVERKANLLAGQMLTVFSVAALEIFVSCAITGQFRFFSEFLKIYSIMFLLQSLVNCLLTIPMVDLYRKTFPPLTLIEIHGDYDNDLVLKMDGLRYKYHVAERISCHESEEYIREKISKYDAVLLNDLPSKTKNKLLKICYEMFKRVYFVPKISDVLVKNSQELNLIDTPIFLNRNNGVNPLRRFIKRFFDLVLSALAIVILSPILIITAIAIKVEDGGPVFFRQERVTIGGKRFMILKFRSMIVDAEKDGRPHPAGEKDDRITRVGHFIRAVRIDELPQLINILKGEMSIVGPRPERWEHVEKYTKDIPEFPFRLHMKGGLTGYAQVYGKYNTTALDKLKLDLLYITNYSILLDVQIIFETIKILVHKDSTEGFTNEASQEMHDKAGLP